MISDDDIDAMFLQLCVMYRMLKSRRQPKRLRRWKVRPNNRDWRTSGYHTTVFKQMKEMDAEQFFQHTRMPRFLFDRLLKSVQRKLIKPKQRISAEERLSIALNFLAHGESFSTIADRYKLGKATVRSIVLETCKILWHLLSPSYVKEPNEQEYKEIANDFDNMWNMTNCVGAIDAKHIDVKCHATTERKLSSIVLMGVCDAEYKFTSISLGSSVDGTDGEIFKTCNFGAALHKNTLPLPPDAPLTEATEPFPHYFVGDVGFPLRNNLMRPYPGANLDGIKTVFNYRLSRVNRVNENAFGVLTARWRILRTTLDWSAENCETIILACVALHNFLMQNDHGCWYCPVDYVDRETEPNVWQSGKWRFDLKNDGGPLISTASFARRGPAVSFLLRDILANYFVNEGAISDQDALVE